MFYNVKDYFTQIMRRLIPLFSAYVIAAQRPLRKTKLSSLLLHSKINLSPLRVQSTRIRGLRIFLNNIEDALTSPFRLGGMTVYFLQRKNEAWHFLAHRNNTEGEKNGSKAAPQNKIVTPPSAKHEVQGSSNYSKDLKMP